MAMELIRSWMGNHFITAGAICIYPTILLQAGCKRSVAGLNSEFIFSKICCHTMAKELSLPYYLLIADHEEMDSFLFQVY